MYHKDICFLTTAMITHTHTHTHTLNASPYLNHAEHAHSSNMSSLHLMAMTDMNALQVYLSVTWATKTSAYTHTHTHSHTTHTETNKLRCVWFLHIKVYLLKVYIIFIQRGAVNVLIFMTVKETLWKTDKFSVVDISDRCFADKFCFRIWKDENGPFGLRQEIGIFLYHYQQLLTGIRETTYHESVTSVSNKFSIYFNDRTNISALARSEDGQLRRRCLVEGSWGVRPHNYLAGCFNTIKNCSLCKWRMFMSEY